MREIFEAGIWMFRSESTPNPRKKNEMREKPLESNPIAKGANRSPMRRNNPQLFSFASGRLRLIEG
jgi:hypothetical protein